MKLFWARGQTCLSFLHAATRHEQIGLEKWIFFILSFLAKDDVLWDTTCLPSKKNKWLGVFSSRCDIYNKHTHIHEHTWMYTHVYLRPRKLQNGWKECKSWRMGINAMKGWDLIMTWLLHTWTHRSNAYPHKTFGGWRIKKLHHELRRGAEEQVAFDSSDMIVIGRLPMFQWTTLCTYAYGKY